MYSFGSPPHPDDCMCDKCWGHSGNIVVGFGVEKKSRIGPGIIKTDVPLNWQGIKLRAQITNWRLELKRFEDERQRRLDRDSAAAGWEGSEPEDR